MLQIAKILKSHGTDGALLIRLQAVCLDQIDTNEPVFIYYDGLPVPFFFQSLQAKGSSKLIAKLCDIDCLRDAEEIVGREIYIEAEEQEEAEEDLNGWSLYDNGRYIGTIDGMELIPGNPCIYLGDTLIPLHEQLINSVDPEKHCLDMNIPEGLL